MPESGASSSITLRELRQSVQRRLEQSCEELSRQTAMLEATEILEVTFRYSPEQLLMNLEAHAGSLEQKRIEEFLNRRCSGEPLAYVLGQKEFYSRNFIVSRDVLIPRPETELLVQQAFEVFSNLESKSFLVVDVGTGSGAILLSLVKEIEEKLGADYLSHGRFLGIDLSRKALEIARQNAERLGVLEYVEFVNADLLSAMTWVPAQDTFFLCLSNPPYIAESEKLESGVEDYEPALALRSGSDGLSAIRQLLTQFAELLAAEPLKDNPLLAHLLMEIGYDQAIEVESLARESGMREISFYKDLQGISRVVEIACQKSFA